MTRYVSIVFVIAAASLAAGQGQPPVSANVQAVDAYVSGKVAAGEMDLEEARDAIRNAQLNGSLTEAEATSLFRKLDEDFEELKKSGAEQQAVFNAEWPLGGVFMGHTYQTSLDVKNACSTRQTVSITYPKNMFLSGAASVDVPAKSTVDVPITIDLSKLQPPPPQPFPIIIPCPVLQGEIVVEHPKAGACLAVRRVYSTAVQLHLHSPATPPDEGGGGGKNKKKKSPVCQAYWDRGEFVPSRDNPTPESCVTELRQYAEDLRAEIQKGTFDPGPWEWLPPGSALAQMSADEIMLWRTRMTAYSAALGAGKGGR